MSMPTDTPNTDIGGGYKGVFLCKLLHGGDLSQWHFGPDIVTAFQPWYGDSMDLSGILALACPWDISLAWWHMPCQWHFALT